jgi:MHS family proline/betaine transporter-like MFS transporter
MGWVLFAVVLGVFLGPVPIVLVELFPIEVRYTGMSLAYNFTAAFFGGTTPMVATWLIQQTGDTTSPAFYVVACAVVTLFTMRYFNADMKKKKS